MFNKHLRNFFSLVFSLLPIITNGQANLETFGQNRIQYRTFDWRFYETEHFKVYHYDRAGRMLARYVAEQSENDIALIESKLGGKFPLQFKIILYNNYDEYRQTNIGKKQEEQAIDNPAGTLDLVNDVLTVYFTGVHTELRRQIQNGMARVVMKHQLFGEDVREVVKNAVVQNIPDWMANGYTDYMILGWDASSNDSWRNTLQAYPDKNFYQLTELEPAISGRAFWKYMMEQYGLEGSRRLMLSMMEDGNFAGSLKKFTQNKKLNPIFQQILLFYKNAYASDNAQRTVIDSVPALYTFPIPNDGTTISNIKVSPHGSDVAYVEWKNGEFKVILVRTGEVTKKSVILTGGRSNFNAQPDPNYPILCWNNTGFKLGIMYRRGNTTKLRIYNSLRSKIENYDIPPNRFERVLGMTFLADDQQMLISAIKRSQTDLYEFTFKGKRMTNVTNDIWDDLEPTYVSDGARKGILFLSNRPKAHLNAPAQVNELPNKPLNVYFYNTSSNDSNLLQLTKVDKGHIAQPIQYGPDNYAYLYDIEGINNRYVILFGRTIKNLDSPISVPVTNYERGIFSHQFNPASQQIADVIKSGRQFKVLFKPVKVSKVNEALLQIPRSILYEHPDDNELPTTSLTQRNLTTVINNDKPTEQLPVIDTPLSPKDPVYQSEFSDQDLVIDLKKVPVEQRIITEDSEDIPIEIVMADSMLRVNPQMPDSEYVKMRSQPYKLAFRPDFFSIRLDNSVLFNRYQSISNAYNANPSLGGMVTMSLNDVMEDYRFSGGFRFPTNLSGLSYFLGYDNFRRRTDWGFLFVRIENLFPYAVRYIDTVSGAGFQRTELAKSTSSLLQLNVNYPLDRLQSIRMSLGAREDKMTVKAPDTIALFIPQEKSYYASSRVEYVFDNSEVLSMNLRQGFRYKVFGEYFYGLNNDKGGFFNIGLDFRTYQKLYRNSIFANRIASAYSAGNRKVLFYVGGIDNALNGQWSNLPSNATEDYAFQSMVNSVRGYPQNARNGNTYLVMNNEIRIPITKVLFARPISNVILRHLQLVPFIDVGSAWKGFKYSQSGFDKDIIAYQPPNPVIMQLKIPSQSGFAVGYGAGLRTQLFGYFLRTDLAWNVDDRRRKPVLHVGLGTDF